MNIGDQAGEMGDDLKVTDIGASFAPQTIKAGSTFTCAKFANDQIKCFGHGQYGKLLQGNNNNIGDEPGELG